MKKIILSLAIIAVVGGLVGGATWAYFADQAEVSGNTISTGNVDLEIRGIGWHTTGEYYDAITFDMEWDNIYPGWSDSYDIQFRNESSIDSGLDVIPSLERESGAGQQLRDVITLQFVSDSGQTDTLTLEEWRDNEDVLEHLASSEEGEEWTLKFEFPSTGEDQNELQNSEEFEFDLVFDGIQAETPINEVTNENTEGTYDTIQEAVDGADEGDTILIPSGTYDGINLDRELTLKGVGIGDAIIVSSYVSGESRPNGIFVNTDGEVNIENIRFENGGIDMGEFPQGILTSGSYNPEVNVSDSEFIDLHMGVYFNPGASGVITNNTFDGMNHTAIGIDSVAGVDITDNQISNASVGIEIFRTGVTRSGNTFDNVDTNVDDQS